MVASPRKGSKVINPMTGREITVGGAAYERLPIGTRVLSPRGKKTYVVRKSSRRVTPSSPLPRKGYVHYDSLKLGKKVRNPRSGRRISIGSSTYRALYSGIVDLDQSPNTGKCRQYPYIPEKFLCGKNCGTSSCYPVNSGKRYAAAHGYSNKYLGNSPKGRCIRKCADKIKSKYEDDPAWVGGKYQTPYYASPKRIRSASRSPRKHKGCGC